MERVSFQKLLTQKSPSSGETLTVSGWARSVRLLEKGQLIFIQLYDGSSFKDVQVIVRQSDFNSPDRQELFQHLQKGKTGWSFTVTGKVVSSPGEEQTWEIRATDVTVHGECADDYPLQKRSKSEKKRGIKLETLRQYPHLRPRTFLFSAVQRLRHCLAMSVHDFYRHCDFTWVSTPLITFSDCEGAGEAFLLETQKTQKTKGIEESGFFQQQPFLTVSGQLEGECYATAMSKVYTFGPTFRAEESKTTRHLAEFWMIEPEVAFVSMDELITVAEQTVKFSIRAALEECREELEFLDRKFSSSKVEGASLLEKLQKYVDTPFVRLSYTDAIKVLQTHVQEKKVSFEESVEWGIDLGSEHEKYLCEQVYQCPTVLFGYPADIKAFYMKPSETSEVDRKTVQAFDLLVPGVGELVGGSIRQEDFELLTTEMQRRGMELEPYKMYLDLRRYGTVPHGGFGIGFERLIQFVGGIPSIKDTIPFPRYYGSGAGTTQ